MIFSLIADKEKILELLKHFNGNQARLAQELEVHKSTVGRWLSGTLPKSRQSRDINSLYKQYVDIRSFVLKTIKSLKKPINLLQHNMEIQKQLFLQMTYHSNAIEGNPMTIHDTQDIFDGLVIKNSRLPDIMEIVNHKNALDFLLEEVKPGFRITKDFILELHKLIMMGFKQKLPGKYRTGFVNLTNTYKKLPSAQDVPHKMDKLIRTFNQYGHDPIGHVSKCHYDFESIHPFFDGNGRTGRLVMMTQLLSQGFPPSVIQIDDRYQYYEALERGDNGETTPMVQVVCDGIITGFRILTGELKVSDYKKSKVMFG